MRLAARGLRDLDRGTEPMRDAAERAAVRVQARRIARKSIAAAVLVTTVYLLVTA